MMVTSRDGKTDAGLKVRFLQEICKVAGYKIENRKKYLIHRISNPIVRIVNDFPHHYFASLLLPCAGRGMDSLGLMSYQSPFKKMTTHELGCFGATLVLSSSAISTAKVFVLSVCAQRTSRDPGGKEGRKEGRSGSRCSPLLSI